MRNYPIVSVGIPTFNRPDGLKRTLDFITNQTYTNLEIIVSDNATEGSIVESLMDSYLKTDGRIKFFKQENNKGAEFNFRFVLDQSSGDYFMWAADDDCWESFFIDELVNFLENDVDMNFVSATFEAQYIDNGNKKYHFFNEGVVFDSFYTTNQYLRVKNVLNNNYGNLVYALFRTNLLKSQKLLLYNNEIPFLIQLSFLGNIKVFNKIGFYKTAPSYNTFIQARWEKIGGKLAIPYNKQNFKLDLKYHLEALKKITLAINNLKLDYFKKFKLKYISTFLMAIHLFYLLIRYKPKKIE